MTTPPPGEPPRDPDDSPGAPPAWAWEPTPPSNEPEPPTEPPAADGGAEMLERLRQRGLLGETEPSPETSSPPQLTPEPTVGVAAGTAAAVSGSPPEAPTIVPAAPLWPPVPPPPPSGDRYPMEYDVEFPKGLNRGTTFLRIFLVIPVLVLVSILQYFVQTALMVGFVTVFFRRKYPGWLFTGITGAYGFLARGNAYGLLLTDKFPSFSHDQSPVTLEYDEPPNGQLSRWRVLFWKFILLIPQFFVLSFLFVAVFAVTIIAWFAILFTGNYPRGLFQFVVGVQRWYWRIAGYFASFNDRYPPYALSPEAGPASNGSTVANGIIGAVVAGGIAALFIAVASISSQVETVDADYAALTAGRAQYTTTLQGIVDDGEGVTLRLAKATDPGDELVQIVHPTEGQRVIVFHFTVKNGSQTDAYVARNAVFLTYEVEDDEGVNHEITADAVFIAVGNLAAPALVGSGGGTTVEAAFVVPIDAEPLELRFRGGFAHGGVRYVFD